MRKPSHRRLPRLLRAPEVVLRLHVHPKFRSRAQGGSQPDRHRGGDSSLAVQHARQRHARNTQMSRRRGDSQTAKIFAENEPGMRWFVHALRGRRGRKRKDISQPLPQLLVVPDPSLRFLCAIPRETFRRRSSKREYAASCGHHNPSRAFSRLKISSTRVLYSAVRLSKASITNSLWVCPFAPATALIRLSNSSGKGRTLSCGTRDFADELRLALLPIWHPPKRKGVAILHAIYVGYVGKLAKRLRACFQGVEGTFIL